jgi:hypothetical protein
LSTGVVDKYSPDHLGGDAEEMCAIAPLDPLLVDEPYESFMNQRGALEGMVGAFVPKVCRSQAP